MTSLPVEKPEARDASGRFLPGCRPGPGRPKRRDLRAIVEASGTDVDADLTAITATLFDAAKGGDVQAAGLLLRHLVTAPAVGIELDVQHDGGRDPETDARTLMSILASAAAGDDRVAAQLAIIALKSAPSAQLREVATALEKNYPEVTDATA